MHLQEPGDFRDRLLVVMDELARVRDLLGREGRGGTEPHAPRLRRDPAGARAFHDQAALEIRNAGKHGQHHAPGRRRRVGPRLGQAAQTGAGRLDALGNVQQVACAARQAVQPGDCHHVAGAQMIEHAGQLNPVAPGTRDLFCKNPGAAGRVQLGPLIGQVLVLGADADIAE